MKWSGWSKEMNECVGYGYCIPWRFCCVVAGFGAISFGFVWEMSKGFAVISILLFWGEERRGKEISGAVCKEGEEKMGYFWEWLFGMGFDRER